MPRIYVLAVHTTVYVTVGMDFFVLATYVAHALVQDEFNSKGWFVVLFSCIICIVFLLVITTILDLSREFFNPFGTDPINFPVLTWCCACAAETLTVCTRAQPMGLRPIADPH